MPFALFADDRQIGPGLPSEAEVWKQALDASLISDLPVADEATKPVLPARYHVKEIREECCAPDPAWKLPDEIS
ncbi:hypothetical protein [Bradyrhizobium sp. sBnM-33]|uniref:hypothetical protein n=1 Tax=Bradyrhizobium sp. sBnM-33 TaxID=2831780 RepID=UPI001BCC461E|nr:hypothetical protein [Bradyrhizobium sp. sBnM-33]WOH48663.1 hypothetical protein RX328_31885 [Bradyrhizobium sp. sBnM-33]